MLFINRLNQSEEGEKIRNEVKNNINRYGGGDRVMVGVCVEKKFEGSI